MERSKTEGKDSPCRSFPSPPDPRARSSREKNSAAFCPRASCGRRTDGAREGRGGGGDGGRGGIGGGGSAPNNFFRRRGPRVTIDSTTLPPPAAVAAADLARPASTNVLKQQSQEETLIWVHLRYSQYFVLHTTISYDL